MKTLVHATSWGAFAAIFIAIANRFLGSTLDPVSVWLIASAAYGVGATAK